MLNADGCVDLIKDLAKELDEDVVIGYLVDIYTSAGTIVDRIGDLAEAESKTEFRIAGETGLMLGCTAIFETDIDRVPDLYLQSLSCCFGECRDFGFERTTILILEIPCP